LDASGQRYTGGSGYPSLGTFYKHVNAAGGVSEYMKWRFDCDIEDALRRMSIADKEIETLLSRRSQVVAGPLRHPYG
jgi:hypothetical protein